MQERTTRQWYMTWGGRGIEREARARLPERNYHFVFIALACRSTAGTGLLIH